MINKNLLAYHLLLLAIISSFITIKIYPVVYFFCIIYSISQGITFKNLSLIYVSFPFFIYAIFSYVFTGNITEQANLAFMKLVVNFLFFIFICLSACFFKNENIDAERKLKIIEFYLRLALIFSLLQMLWLQLQSGGLRFDSGNSYAAGMMFSEHTILWGVEDKNMAGAKIGLFGFLHAFVYKRLKGKISYSYALLYIFCAALTLSRTSVILAVLTFLVLYLFSIKPVYRYIIILPILSLLFSVLFSDVTNFIRLDSVRSGSSDDGMAIRLLYWSAFFNNFDAISPLGNGILSAIDFLRMYSATGSANNMHNLYLNTFLDLGYVGIFFYLCIFIVITVILYRRSRIKTDCIVMLFPILLLTNTLYTAYDNDPWLYYALVIVISGLYVGENYKKVLHEE